ncbi:MAG TPA: aminoacyl-tRNA hydrolase [Firmicutes bacterium]|jgi:PTH1 family peptidyl-tRNA hydrolase|nr:aminoacyl-tRNA hydrolase [Bacillota bacterium]NLH86654.1 aminoacyl-tRNA hydrolase [Bacillota bacterium]HAN86922.1 aminoacyl-tRNA hydrolase [Bacillota bacterium]
MFLIAGLGNPGSRYECSRHNAGFMTADRIALKLGAGKFRRAPYCFSLVARAKFAGTDMLILKPQTYMNNSGVAVARATRWHRVGPESLIVVYDDMDLEVGKIRIRTKGSAGGHKGMGSIIEHMGTEEITRVRIGVGRPPPWEDSVDYVLDTFTREELPIISDAVINAISAILCIIEDGIEAAQTRFN